MNRQILKSIRESIRWSGGRRVREGSVREGSELIDIVAFT